MTEQEQNTAIAKWMGAKICPVHLAYECCGNKVPDYLHDLNAMRDAAMHLRVSSPLTYIHYAVELTKIVAKFNSDLENDHAISDHDASAAQRAEALLKTIGKWTT